MLSLHHPANEAEGVLLTVFTSDAPLHPLFGSFHKCNIQVRAALSQCVFGGFFLAIALLSLNLHDDRSMIDTLALLELLLGAAAGESASLEKVCKAGQSYPDLPAVGPTKSQPQQMAERLSSETMLNHASRAQTFSNVQLLKKPGKMMSWAMQSGCHFKKSSHPTGDCSQHVPQPFGNIHKIDDTSLS